jgi:MFS transporter, DHA3 family, macrolide efflux protein
MVSQSGDYIFDVVAIWYVLQLTHSYFLVGLTTAIILLPIPTVGPLAGVYVDKFNRRDIILVSNIFQAAVTASIAALYSLGGLSFVVFLVLLFLLNAGAQFVRPSITAVIPAISSKEDLATANSLFTISSSTTQIAGYGIGGVLILLLGVAIPIYYDSFTFIFAAATAVLISRSLLRPAGVPSAPIEGVNAESFKEKFLEGLRFIRTSRFLLEIISLAVVLNFFGGGIQALMSPYALTTLGGNAGTYGSMLAALSLGVVTGSILIGKIEARKYVGKLLFGGVFGVGGAVALMGLTTISALAIGLMFTVGFSIALANLPLQILVQARVPGNLLGRVFTSLGALVTVATPVAAITTGGLARSIQIGPTLQLYGALMLATTAIAYFAFREVRDVRY